MSDFKGVRRMGTRRWNTCGQPLPFLARAGSAAIASLQWLCLVITLFSCRSKATSTGNGGPEAAVASESEGAAGGLGRWEMVSPSIGISAMHMALLPNNKLVIFDRTDFGTSNISLPHGRCRDDVLDRAVPHDCSAHSVEFDPNFSRIRPLTILTDTWCSSGALLRSGTIIQTGGFNDGDRAVRHFVPCSSDDSDQAPCDWVEEPNGLAMRRWYATNQVLPDGETVIVIGGRRQFNYEFVPKKAETSEVFDLPFLRETKDPVVENNLYPFVHLMPDGNLFVFANTKSILLDYVNHRVIRRFPEMPGGAARSYPSTGSSVLLPLQLTSDGDAVQAEVMVCGGADPDSNIKANRSIFLPASNTCGRLRITPNGDQTSPAEWVMMRMPMARVMGDMLLLPTGDVLIINGAARGSAGWEMGRDPVLSPVLYRTGATYHSDSAPFQVLASTPIPRLYHSTAYLLPDGRVLVGGSNPHARYQFSGVLFPTELSLQAFHPPYLMPGSPPRPSITAVTPGDKVTYGQNITVKFELDADEVFDVKVTMMAPSFTTHSLSMNQRLLVLPTQGVRRSGGGRYQLDGITPATAALAPAGYYLLFVVHDGVPSKGAWVQIANSG